MIKRWLFILALLLPLSAQAGELEVTINFAAGSEPIRYNLSADQTRAFWGKWNLLSATDAMVPLPAGADYGGLTLYDDDSDTSVRLFDGVGRSNEKARKDDYRQLERWVLTMAPLPLGPSLIAALDDDIKQQPGGAQAIPQNILAGVTVIKNCEARAGNNLRVKAYCLHEQLIQQLDTADYVKALEDIATSKLPIRPGSSIETDQAARRLGAAPTE